MRIFSLSLIPILSLGQEIYVRSEFQRPGPNGVVIAADKMNQRGREVLSPPALRNAFTTLHVTVEAPAGTPVVLYVGLNPEDAIKPTLYLENHLAGGEPNGLEEVKPLPFNGKIPESGALNFLLDMWVNEDATVQRVKVEPQLWVSDRWIVYPMEVRILELIVPKHTYQMAKLPGPGFRADGVVWVSWPKKTSKVPTDISDNTVRELALPLGFVDVKVCAVSEVWSGLKLVIRKGLR